MTGIGNRWRRGCVSPALAVVLWLTCYQSALTTPVGPAVALTRGPYLQSVTTDTVTVVWETDLPGTSRVDYGPDAAYGLFVSSSVLVTRHVLTLTGLSPYSRTHYRVSTDGQPLSADDVFRSAAPPEQASFSFVAFGDTRTGHAAHSQVVNSIVSLAPDLVLHTGDFVANGLDPDQWATFFTIEQALLRQAPLFGAIGNHEHNSPLYFDAFVLPGGERWYSFDYGNVHFVALEIDADAPDYAPGSAQMLWLENDLAQTHQRWKVVFFHVPPYSSGLHGSDLGVRQALEPLFIRYGVDLVFNGHDHDYERSVANHIVYIVTGGGGAPLYSQVNSNPASVYFTSTHHSVQVTVTESSLMVVGVRSDGVRFDEFTLEKPVSFYLPVVVKQPSLAMHPVHHRGRWR
jgi:hypothetical protein